MILRGSNYQRRGVWINTKCFVQSSVQDILRHESWQYKSEQGMAWLLPVLGRIVNFDRIPNMFGFWKWTEYWIPNIFGFWKLTEYEYRIVVFGPNYSNSSNSERIIQQMPVYEFSNDLLKELSHHLLMIRLHHKHHRLLCLYILGTFVQKLPNFRCYSHFGCIVYYKFMQSYCHFTAFSVQMSNFFTKSGKVKVTV